MRSSGERTDVYSYVRPSVESTITRGASLTLAPIKIYTDYKLMKKTCLGPGGRYSNMHGIVNSHLDGDRSILLIIAQYISTKKYIAASTITRRMLCIMGRA